MQQYLRLGLSLAFLFSITHTFAQRVDPISDTLPGIVIKAFESNRKLKDVAAPVGYINKTTLTLFNSNAIIAAMNSVPGVRMEERSPGSYRLNIRGSSLRSPFGVRNVKIYFNDLLFTDPGGHSYLNQLGYYNFNSIEIIKGSNNSIYGAGTGGVLLVESIGENEKPNIFAEYTTGSYNLQNIYGSITTATANSITKFGWQHQQCDGYRVHSQLKKDVYSWNGFFRFNEKHILKTTFLYGDHFYQTPGALTKSEYEINPAAARPGNAFFPGAELANTSIHQKMFLAGFSYSQPISRHITNKTTLDGMFTQLQNPSIASYGKSSEPNIGGRTTFNYDGNFNHIKLQVNTGLEYQQGFTSVSIYKNLGGNPDSLRNTDEINNRQQFVFAQVTVDYKTWSFVAGASLGQLRINFQRFSPQSSASQTRVFSNQLAPRLSIMKKFANLNIYSSISKGYSPPTTAELFPTGGTINLDLNAEEGTSYEAGIKATPVKNLYVDANIFFYHLSSTIVQRRNAGGTDFFVNAGRTRQKGVELYSSYALFHKCPIFRRSLLWVAYTLYDFHYRDFKQITADYSGNKLPSVAPNTLFAGVELQFNNGFFGNINYFLSDKIALTDANTDYAKLYQLLGTKLGYEYILKNGFSTKLAAGVENIFDETYSQGNDINGFGGRYYNAASRRNFYISLQLQDFYKKRKG
ncbi:MAG: TonB-dependent receptor [Ferruginibacter sp.]